MPTMASKSSMRAQKFACEQAHRPVDAYCSYWLCKWFCRNIKLFDGRNLPLSERGVTARADFSMDRPHDVVDRGEMGEVEGFRRGHSFKVGSGNGGLKVLS